MIALIILAQMLAPQATDSPFFDVLPPQANAQPGSGSRSPFINVRAAPYFAPCDGTNDDQPAFALAIAAVSATGGVIDAVSCTGGVKFASSLTINKPGAVLKFPPALLSLGTNQIIVSPGTHNVSIVGGAPYGNAVNRTTAGTTISYTGTGTAILVGDSSTDTYGFVGQDLTLNLEAAGSAAIGIQLNRAIQFVLQRPRIHGLTSANTQIAVDLEGSAQFTGGRVEDYYVWNGATAFYLGKNANANIFSGGIIVNNVSGGTCFNVAGDVTGNADGNVWIGGDCEGIAATIFAFDYGSRNQVFGMRAEAPTATVMNATVHSVRNTIWTAGSVLVVTDAGTANSVFTTTTYQFTPGLWQLINNTDTASELRLGSGTAATQQTKLSFYDQGVKKFYWLKDASNNLILRDGSDFARFLSTPGSGNMNLNTATGSGTLQVNMSANAGTGGLQVGGGGASPAQAALINSNTRGTITLSTGSGTATVTSGQQCVCTDTTANASVKCSVTTSTLTATGTGSDVIQYLCL